MPDSEGGPTPESEEDFFPIPEATPPVAPVPPVEVKEPPAGGGGEVPGSPLPWRQAAVAAVALLIVVFLLAYYLGWFGLRQGTVTRLSGLQVAEGSAPFFDSLNSSGVVYSDAPCSADGSCTPAGEAVTTARGRPPGRASGGTRRTRRGRRRCSSCRPRWRPRPATSSGRSCAGRSCRPAWR